MNDLQIQITQQGTITTNLDTLKSDLQEIADRYSGIVVSEDDITLAKKDLAELRKIKDDVESRRKSVKKEWARPYEEFEKKVKEALSIIEKPIGEIDRQIKEFAEREKQEKREQIEIYYKEEVGEYAEYLPLNAIFNEKWLNKSATEKDIRFDLNSSRTKVITDLDAIRALNSEFEDELIQAYKKSGNSLQEAIKRNSDLISAKQRAEQRAKEEAERKAREEAERAEEARKAEEARLAEEAKEEPVEDDLPFPGGMPVEDDLPFPEDMPVEEEATFVIHGDIDKAEKILREAGIKFEVYR